MEAVRDIARECVGCNLCTKECAFLDAHGTPGELCAKFLLLGQSDDSPVFSCNLCNLCQVVCPRELDCANAFLAMRRAIQAGGGNDTKDVSVHVKHAQLCAYEARGRSKLFSLHQFPEGCEAVFFPGCTLAATRAGVTQAVYGYLQSLEPTMGIVLDCCAKPSHDLGLDERFERSFDELLTIFRRNKIQTVYTGCPSCQTTFATYGQGLQAVSLYQLLADHPPPLDSHVNEQVCIHDTCTSRFLPAMHDSVRQLVRGTGAEVIEVPHSREKALCCGEGAAAQFVAPEITANWQRVRQQESDGRRVITYCAGCATLLGKELRTTHLLDLLFDQDRAMRHRERVTKSPWTYLQRLLLKRRLRRQNR